MARIEVLPEVRGSVWASYVRKPALWALECDSCHQVYKMEGRGAGEMTGQFDIATAELGNMFEADVCSLGCASRMFMGGWQELDRYQEHARAGATLDKVNIQFSHSVKFQKQLIDEWKALPDLDAEHSDQFFLTGLVPLP